jgi:hypothetical protein
MDLRKTLGVYNLERAMRAAGVSDILAGPVRAAAKQALRTALVGLRWSPEQLGLLADVADELSQERKV